MAASQADETLLAQLRDRVGQRVTDWRPGARVRGVSPLTGGTSSLTFLVELAGVAAGETPVVLKVAPPGLAPLRNRDVLRQARLQQAVQGSRRPLAPDVLFSDPGDPPEVPPFMAMNLVAGECVEPVLSDGGRAARARPGAGPVLRRRAGARAVARDRPGRGGAWRRAGRRARRRGRPVDPRVRHPAAGDGGRLRAGREGAAGDHARAAAARGQPRRLPAREHPVRRATGSTRSSTGRSGRWATRASTCPG